MALSRQQIVEKLNQIPTFAVVNAQKQLVPINMDTEDSADSVAWYTDHTDAKGALAVAKAQNPDDELRLGVTPLGAAFAMVQGWTASNAASPLRLQPSQLLATTFAGVLQEQLETQGIDAGGWRMPIFSCDELQSPRMLPLFLSRADLAATW
eukprot:1271298-Prymnesium_polylepis.1